jgi:hypothetical protein
VTAAPPSGRLRGERWLVAVLAAAAALRVAAFAGAFPLFSNVDEHKHIDTVLKYARGQLPRPGADAFEEETGRLLGRLGSPEYLLAPGARPVPPTWKAGTGVLLRRIERDTAFLAGRANKEAFQPPVYYATAAAWLWLGRALGLEHGHLLYWLRGLGALGLALLVLLAHRSLASLYPDDAFLRLGVPILLCVFPMDAFFYVTRDALSPLLGGAGFLLAVRLARAPDASARAFAACGAAVAAACLGKYTQVVLLGVMAWASAHVLRQRGTQAARRLLLLWVLAVAPVALWLLRNWLLFGDPTATALKAQRLGWEPRPVGEWLDHPLLTPAGLARFVGGLVPKFWRGELAWHRETLAWPPADVFYTATSLLFVLLAAAGVLRGRERARPEAAALLAVVLAVACLGALSLPYRFPEVGNPSAARPWFDHGRLIAGVLLPFALLYAQGLRAATAPLPARLRGGAAWAGLGVVAAVCLLSEIGLTAPVFLSAYNAYHLP